MLRVSYPLWILVILLLGLNTFFVLIFVVFVADGPHFDKMFKMVLIFAIHVLFGPFL